MKQSVEVFVDTSGFKALVDEKDEFHYRAVEKWDNFARKGVSLVTSNYILDESYTLIRVKCGLKVVKNFRILLAEGLKDIKVSRITLDDELLAWDWFGKDWSGLSFTDCVSFTVMKRLGIKQVFGFDNHFKRAGFEVVN